MTKISTYNLILRRGITATPGENTFVVPYKPGDAQSDFAGNGAMLLVNGGRLVLREDTDTFQIAYGAGSFTVTWHDLLHNIGDTDDVSITTDIFNTFVGLGIAGSTPGGPAGGDLTGFYPDPVLIPTGPGGVHGDATHVPQFTLDSKGRVLAVTPVEIVAPSTSVPGGPAGGDLAGTYPNPVLKAIITAGTFGGPTTVPQITVDAKGRTTVISDVPISGVPGPPTGPAGGDLTGTYPAPTIAAGMVGNTKLGAMGQARIKGRPAGAGSGDPQDLDHSQVVAILSTAPVNLGSALSAPNVTTPNLFADLATMTLAGIDTLAATDVGVSGGVVVGAPTGGNLGPGTVNVSTGYYLNGELFESGGGGGAIMTGTTVRTNVPAAVASTQLMASNPLRLGGTIYNDSAAEMYVNLGAAASPTAFTVDMLPGSYYEVPYGFFGAIHAIWAATTGNARVTEFFA